MENLSPVDGTKDVPTKEYVDTGLSGKAPTSHTHSTYVAKAGDTMTGALGLGTNRIHNLGEPVNDDHATTKGYVDGIAANYLPLTGGTLTGSLASQNIDMAWHSLTSVWKAEIATLGGIPAQSGGDITLTNSIDCNGNVLYNVPDPTTGDRAANKDYVDSIVGQTDHGSLGGLADDDHLQYAPIAVVDGADPVPPGTPERPGTLIIRENTTGDELGFLQKQGGTMTGPLVLQSDPAAPLEAATKQYIDDLLAPVVNVGSWAEAYEYVTNKMDATVTANFTSLNASRPGWTISNGMIRAPWTGNYMLVHRFTMTPAQIQVWVGHEGYPNPVLNNWEGEGTEQWMTYTYHLRLSAGAGVPRPIIYGAGGNAWNSNLIQSVMYMGNA